MSFYSTQDFPNRKDRRKPAHADPTCNPHGGCPWCEGNRTYQERKEMERLSVEDEFPATEANIARAHVFMERLSETVAKDQLIPGEHLDIEDVLILPDYTELTVKFRQPEVVFGRDITRITGTGWKRLSYTFSMDEDCETAWLGFRGYYASLIE